MQGLRGTFATRFNRLRRENGHIFQGRYKSLLVESGEYLGALCHSIHLNPVRAGICGVEQLGGWPWTSLQWMLQPRQRRKWYDPRESLVHGGARKRRHVLTLDKRLLTAARPLSVSSSCVSSPC